MRTSGSPCWAWFGMNACRYDISPQVEQINQSNQMTHCAARCWIPSKGTLWCYSLLAIAYLLRLQLVTVVYVNCSKCCTVLVVAKQLLSVISEQNLHTSLSSGWISGTTCRNGGTLSVLFGSQPNCPPWGAEAGHHRHSQRYSGRKNLVICPALPESRNPPFLLLQFSMSCGSFVQNCHWLPIVSFEMYVLHMVKALWCFLLVDFLLECFPLGNHEVIIST